MGVGGSCVCACDLFALFLLCLLSSVHHAFTEAGPVLLCAALCCVAFGTFSRSST